MTKPKKQGRWVASDAKLDGYGGYTSLVYPWNDNVYPRIEVRDSSRDGCREIAAAIRDLANTQNWR